MSKHGFWVKSGKAVVAVHREEVSAGGCGPGSISCQRRLDTGSRPGETGVDSIRRTDISWGWLIGGSSILSN